MTSTFSACFLINTLYIISYKWLWVSPSSQLAFIWWNWGVTDSHFPHHCDWFRAGCKIWDWPNQSVAQVSGSMAEGVHVLYRWEVWTCCSQYCHKPVPGQHGGEAENPEQWSLKHALHLYFSVLRDKPFHFLFKLVWADIAVTGTQESLWVYVVYVKT